MSHRLMLILRNRQKCNDHSIGNHGSPLTLVPLTLTHIGSFAVKLTRSDLKYGCFAIGCWLSLGKRPLDITTVVGTLSVLKIIDNLPFGPVMFLGTIFALMPFTPEPHLWQKAMMIANGLYMAPIDWFDIFVHGGPALLVIVKLTRHLQGHSGDEG